MNKATMTKEQRDTAIRRLRSRGLKYREISSRLNVSHGTVGNILHNYPYSTARGQKSTPASILTKVAKKAVVAKPKKTRYRKATKKQPIVKWSFSLLWGLINVNNESFKQ